MFKRETQSEKINTATLEVLEKRAEKGELRALFILGVLYYHGRGVDQDYSQARECWAQAAEHDHLGALVNLGLLYRNGDGVAQDYDQARQYYERAAKHDDAQAFFNLGGLYAHGRGVAQDYDQARQYYERAAEHDDAQAFFNLGALYAHGCGVAQDYDQARQYYERAAKQDHLEALVNLGVLYRNGDGVDQDYSQARQYWARAAEQNHAGAFFNLGLFYYKGEGVAQDYDRARQYYERAAEQDHVTALFSLGILYAQGHGVAQDDDRARQYYERAAEQNDVRALFNLGCLYDEGCGVEQDYDRAHQYYERAAEQNHVRALFNLGVLHAQGHGVDQDYSQARQYWERAAEQDCAEALFNLGVLYDEGRGVDQDYSQARQYWERAAKFGCLRAIRAIEKLPPQISCEANAASLASGEKTLTPRDSAASAEDGAAKEMASLSLASRADKAPFEISESHVSYNPEHALGRGSYGEVFKGLYHGAEVAIKFLQLSPSAFTERLLTGFRKEAKMMAQLNHPNVVHFYGVTTIDASYGLVMEYASGGSLYQVLHGKSDLSWVKRIQWGVEIGNGLGYLHAQQPESILHRDLKSPNVLISAGGQAKLTDFGLAMSKVRTQTQTLSTSGKSGKAAARAEDAVGSLRWMAPELLSLRPKYGVASDIYAFAIVLWELSSRALPYAEQHDDGIIRDAVKSGDREEISEDCPAELKEAIESGWEQDTKARPTANRLVKTLQASAILAVASSQQPAPSQADLLLPGAAATIASSRGYAPLRTENPAESTASGYVLRTN